MAVGKLYVCPTPIGNLEDITIRTLKVLRHVDVIAAEDTRRTLKLLNRYRIKKPLISYYAHNEATRTEDILERLLRGGEVGLVSDAGMPGLSDPGFRIIKACIDNDIPIEVLPGPSSILTAMVASGVPCDSFCFKGFFPRKSAERKRFVEELKLAKNATIFFERASRLPQAIEALGELEPDRSVVIARELSKAYEQIVRSNIKSIKEAISKMPLKGEVVVVIAGGIGSVREIELAEKLFVSYVTSGMSRKEALKRLVKETEWSHRDLYKLLIMGGTED